MRFFGREPNGNPPQEEVEQVETPPQNGNGYEQRLQNGEYLGILESYAVSWDMEKAGRDVWQNFFDAAGGTVDGVRYQIAEEGEDENKHYIVTVEGDAEYDYRKLLHIGGTSKEDDSTAGGFGEGSKILSLVLLRDQGFSDVKFGSSDWQLDFSLQQLPEGVYDKPVRGLTAQLAKGEKRQGNFIQLTTSDPEKAKAIITARDLFFSSENPDFQAPTADVKFDEGGGAGFKFLGLDERGYLNKGHLYDAGQRRHFDKDEKWETVDGVNIWSWNKVFGKDRDRGSISRQALEKNLIEPMIAKLSQEEIVRSLEELGPVWEGGKTWSYEVTYKIMDHSVKKLAAENVRLEFPETYLANSAFMPMYISEALKSQGYTLCHNFFEKIGMKAAAEKFREMQEHLKSEPSPEQQQRIETLQQAVNLLQQAFEGGKIAKEIANKEVWLFDRAKENSIVHGQYNEAFVWLSEDILKRPFPEALATYLHEIDHKSGSDQSAEFSYALTNTLRDVVATLLSDPEIFAKFSNLQQRWQLIKLPENESETQELNGDNNAPKPES
ncbi:MAG: hypothetical protein AAB613_02655 [Patescibacteria group bacterium]